jgi:multidrug resistance efflux pump
MVTLAVVVAASALISSPQSASGDLEAQPVQVQAISNAAPDAGITGADIPDAGISSKGRLVPRQWVSLSFTVGGEIDVISVREGDIVSAGPALARLNGQERYEAQVAAAELELLLARQALDDLNQQAGVELALAEQRLAETRKVQDAADWKVKRMKKPVPQRDVEQAHANLLLLEKAIERARKDLRRAEKLWNDEKNLIWWFISRHNFKLNLVLLRGRVAQLEGKYENDLDRINDLKKPVDEIDLQQAEADLATANATVEKAIRDREGLLHGPDPDDLAQAQARIRSAESALRAAQAAFSDSELHAPFTGQAVDIPAKAGEWTRPGQPVMVIANLSAWNVEIGELKESEVLSLQEGQAVQVSLDALPEGKFSGLVESISLLNSKVDGDVTYTVKIALQEHDPRFRWGMTARVKPQEGP